MSQLGRLLAYILNWNKTVELWKRVRQCENYEISNLGRVRNTRTGLVLKQGIDKYGYAKIHLIKDDGTNYYVTIHRLVAIHWVEGRDETKNQVNHINGIKLNNLPENLEWCDARHNVNHSLENLLGNINSQVRVTDLAEKTTCVFKSIKHTAKTLELATSVLVPLIRNSKNNPVYGRYILELIDEERALGVANTENFGVPVFVYDVIDGSTKKYASILLASYFTGIRSLGGIDKRPGPFECIGYVISKNPDSLAPYLVSDNPEAVLITRQEYLNKPYVKRNHTYTFYDYYKKTEHSFENLFDARDFLNSLEPFDRILKVSNLSAAIGDGKRDKRSGIIKGYGIKSSQDGYDWFPYTEEVILTNKAKMFAVPVFRVRIENSEKIVFGKHSLCDYVGYCPDKPYSKITLDEILTWSSNVPNLCVTRLNKPVV